MRLMTQSEQKGERYAKDLTNILSLKTNGISVIHHYNYNKQIANVVAFR